MRRGDSCEQEQESTVKDTCPRGKGDLRTEKFAESRWGRPLST